MEDSCLSLTGRRWVWPEPVPCSTTGSRPLPAWMSELLARRGVIDPTAVQRYLEPSLASLDDPLQMADMDKAVRRLCEAVSNGEPITVFGDYDVDGVCSTTVLVEFLRQVGAQASYYIPDRRAEGYGLNEEAVRQLARQARLLVTADCGITSLHEITVARQLGMDVIVVDHHRVPEQLPPAIACLDPHRPDCRYPFADLCAAGVAFMLVAALRRALREAGAFANRREPDLRDLLDIVALATVADMVPIRDTNRVLVAAGLRRMASSRRTGLLALCQVSKVDPARATAADLGFRLGPRVNARGRMSHASQAVELMLTDDAQNARVLAAALDAANRSRREVEVSTVKAAEERVEHDGLEQAAGLVVFDPTWHPGVLGLVASRLTNRFHRPAIVIGEGGKGSGRSIPGLDLHACIAAASTHLVRFGGHPAAAGVTIEAERVAAFREAFSDQVRQRLGLPPFVPVLRPDIVVSGRELGVDMLQGLERLAPFGQGNPEPLMVSRQVEVRSKRVVGGSHLKLRLGPQGHDAIGFGLGPIADQISNVLDVAFHLQRNTYNGQQSVQLRVEDLRAAG